MHPDLDSLYRTYSRKVYCYLLSLSSNPELSEDLMQETFLKAALKIGSFRQESSLSSWLCAIAKNLYMDAMRRQKTSVSAEDLALYEDFQKRDLRIFSCLHDLPEPYREIVYLRTFCSMSFREIGEILNKTESWSRVMYYRGKEKLKALWLAQKEESDSCPKQS